MPFDPSSYGPKRGFDPDSDIVLINDGGPFAPSFARRRGRGRTKQRTTIEIHSEPLLHDFSERLLGAEPAQAIRDLLERRIKSIAAEASLATQRLREVGARSLQAGARWATKRYSGGRTGTKAPTGSRKMFNDSGRMSEGLFVRENPTDASYTVNVPANRLDPSTFTPAAFRRMLDRLRELVPELSDSRRLLADKEVRGAIDRSIDGLISKATGNSKAKLEALKRARRQALGAVLRGITSLAGG